MTVDPRSSASSSPSNKDKLDASETAVTVAHFTGLNSTQPAVWAKFTAPATKPCAAKSPSSSSSTVTSTTQEYVDAVSAEAEITSRLDHPGVVPVFGVGHSADTKRPFYAMRFIEGVHFREAIEEHHQKGEARLELHRLLTHLVAVCNTVAYCRITAALCIATSSPTTSCLASSARRCSSTGVLRPPSSATNGLRQRGENHAHETGAVLARRAAAAGTVAT